MVDLRARALAAAARLLSRAKPTARSRPPSPPIAPSTPAQPTPQPPRNPYLISINYVTLLLHLLNPLEGRRPPSRASFEVLRHTHKSSTAPLFPNAGKTTPANLLFRLITADYCLSTGQRKQNSLRRRDGRVCHPILFFRLFDFARTVPGCPDPKFCCDPRFLPRPKPQ